MEGRWELALKRGLCHLKCQHPHVQFGMRRGLADAGCEGVGGPEERRGADKVKMVQMTCCIRHHHEQEKLTDGPQSGLVGGTL